MIGGGAHLLQFTSPWANFACFRSHSKPRVESTPTTPPLQVNQVSGRILASSSSMPFKGVDTPPSHLPESEVPASYAGVQRFGNEFLEGFSGFQCQSDILRRCAIAIIGFLFFNLKMAAKPDVESEPLKNMVCASIQIWRTNVRFDWTFISCFASSHLQDSLKSSL